MADRIEQLKQWLGRNRKRAFIAAALIAVIKTTIAVMAFVYGRQMLE